MRNFSRSIRNALSGLALALGLTHGVSGAETLSQPFLRTGLVQVDVYDRASGAALEVHRKDGLNYIVGTPGNEYALRIRNCTGARILVVASVDGVNVISGETAAPSQSGYVLDPWASVEIKGWRKNLQRTAAFFFTEHQNSYAARTGRPDNVGVIGVAVFREKAPQISLRPREPRRQSNAAESQPFDSAAESQAGARSEAGARSDSPAPAAAARESDDAAVRQEAGRDAAKSLGRLGTGHGRNEASPATLARFDRATETPAETAMLQYDRRENLVALSVLPSIPRVARRNPEPFPGGIRFAPDPWR
jgi:hypothetical protein